MLLIVLLVCFVVVMLVWLLALLGTIGAAYSAWLPFFALLILGVAVFLNPYLPRWPPAPPG